MPAPRTPAVNIQGDFDAADFLQHYWQQKPLLLRDAIDVAGIDISAEELAGLACEDNVNARLVLEYEGDYPWQVEHAPFEESRYSSLPSSGWSLLVSDVERHVPGTRRLLEAFRFIPDWRIDDLMISYAPPGGSVGAHTDAYDVFLIQLSGQRRWQISEHFDDAVLEGTDLRILQSFSAEQDWVLNAGDMLYLPPNIAHHGIAQESLDQAGNQQHCLTASVGFRAPSIETMTSSFVDFLNHQADDHQARSERRYQDRSPGIPKHHAEIDQATIDTFVDYLKQNLSTDPELVRRWLGEYCSDNTAFEELNFENDIPCADFDTLRRLADETQLRLSPYSNCLFSRSGTDAMLFINGTSYQTSAGFAEVFCSDGVVDQALLGLSSPEELELLQHLYNEGIILAQEEQA